MPTIASGHFKSAAAIAGEILSLCEKDLENFTGGEIDTHPAVADLADAAVPAERLLAALRALKAGTPPGPQHLPAVQAGSWLTEACARLHDFAAQVNRNQCTEGHPPEDEFHLFPPELETALDALGVRDLDAEADMRACTDSNAINRASADRHAAAAGMLRERLPTLFRDLNQAIEREHGKRPAAGR